MRPFGKSELQNIVNSCKLMCSGMDKPNIFIMPYDSNNSGMCYHFEKVLSHLESDFDPHVFELKHDECGSFTYSKYPQKCSFKCMVIDSGKTEKIRDAIKKTLWPTDNDDYGAPTLHMVLTSSENTTLKMFDLSEYGEFVPYKAKKYADIRTHSFNHKPVFYRYRVALEKVKQIPENLQSFLQLLFYNCPNHLFQKSEFRASARTCNEFKLEVELSCNHEHELVEYAKNSESFKQFRSRHENLQKYFLLNDPSTIACEVPLWLEANELKDYITVFNTDDVLTGHVDVLRYEADGRIGIWDYKPGASQEIDGAIQVFLYALMLSVRSGIGLNKFLCGYFDETSLFSFKPSEIILPGDQASHS